MSAQSYSIQQNALLGRFLVSNRDLKPGEIIIPNTKPLILAPKMISAPLCLGCHAKVTKANYHCCTHCKWPLCSENCEKSPWHEAECELFTRCNYRPPPNCETDDSKQSIYSIFAPLRALLLLKFKDSDKFTTLMECQSHLQEHLKTRVYQILKVNLVSLFVGKFHLETTDHEILTICSIFDTNSFDIRSPSPRLANIRGLYPTISLMSHDCKRNTQYTFRGDNHELILYAIRPIAEGDKITTSYTQTLWGTEARQSHLMMSKHFRCTCERCSDVSEFGTWAGSVLCTTCGAFLIAPQPLGDWICSSCDFRVEREEMKLGNEILRREILSLDKTDPRGFERFLERYKNVLHETNSHFLEVKYALCQLYGNSAGYELDKLSPDLLRRKVGLCLELLGVADKLEPGWTRFRGCLLYEMADALMAEARLLNLDKVTGQGTYGRCLDYLQESANILALEENLKDLVVQKLDKIKCIIHNK